MSMTRRFHYSTSFPSLYRRTNYSISTMATFCKGNKLMMVNWYWTKCPIPVELTPVAWGGGWGFAWWTSSSHWWDADEVSNPSTTRQLNDRNQSPHRDHCIQSTVLSISIKRFSIEILRSVVSLSLPPSPSPLRARKQCAHLSTIWVCAAVKSMVSMQFSLRCGIEIRQVWSRMEYNKSEKWSVYK